MKRALVLLLVAGHLMVPGFGQNNSIGKNDQEAKKVLDLLSAKLKSFKAIKADFTLKIEDANGKLQGTKSGTVLVKGSKYRLVVTGQEVFCDGKDIWTYDKASNEVTITKADPSAKTISSPEILFTDFYDKDFLYKLNSEIKLGGRTLEEIELTPVDKTKTFFKVYLYIDKKSHLIYSLKWLEKGGNKYTIITNKLNGNAAISDSQFVFDKSKYPGVEEVDLRN
jgi:outer membrane lipoprotein carrier protein